MTWAQIYVNYSRCERIHFNCLWAATFPVIQIVRHNMTVPAIDLPVLGVGILLSLSEFGQTVECPQLAYIGDEFIRTFSKRER